MNFSNWFAGWQSHEGVNQEKLCQWGFLNRERRFSHLFSRTTENVETDLGSFGCFSGLLLCSDWSS